jgi:hypothetical protein
MARKRAFFSKAICIILLLLPFLSGCSTQNSSPGGEPIPLDKFGVRGGVVLKEQKRLEVKYILAGDENVKSLFEGLEFKEPSTLEYYFLRSREINLFINTPEQIEKLRQTIAAQKTDRLKVVLQDDRDTYWRGWSWWSSEDRYKKVIEIPVATTTCDKITRIIYERINSIIKDRIQKAGETEQRIDLGEVFNLLLRDEIEPYIANLKPVEKSDPCFETFQLLKWLRGEDVPGFDFQEYRINEHLQGLLEPIVGALKDIQASSTQFHLTVKTVGYTDNVPVKAISLQKEGTGIGGDGWSTIQNPLDVRYGGCTGDGLDNTAPVYIGYNSGTGKMIGHNIRTNCELGAVRAYVATVYLMNKLGRDGVEYSYATGGVSNEKDDAKKRKINIELTIKAARAEK